MRIISKFKDYYDFLQGKYGIDELKVLDRTISSPPSFSDNSEFNVIFCNTKYIRIKTNDWWYEHRVKNDKKYQFICNSSNNFAWFKVIENFNLKHPIYNITFEDEFVNFSLERVKFNEVLTPEECYLQIEAFLGKDEVSQTIPTDLDRFEAKGFDRKTSFRNIK